MLKKLNYLSVLEQALKLRQEKNPLYSKRAFARDLGLSPSRLSDILGGRSGISIQSALKIIDALKLSPKEREVFLSSLSETKNKVARSLPHFKKISEAQFHVIANWHHYAILELTSLKEFQSDPIWISQRLGIDLKETEDAIERLLKLRMLKKNRGRLVDTGEWIESPEEVLSEGLKLFHSQNLKNAESALHSQSVENREFAGLTIAINKARLPAAKKALRTFLKTFAADFGKSKHKDGVYHLGAQFFELEIRK